MRKPWATWYWIAVLLLALAMEASLGRRGGGRGGGGGGGGSKGGGSSRGSFHSVPKSTSRQNQPSSSSSSRGAKLAGAAAVGAAVGYGLSSLGRPHHSRWGHAASHNKQGTPSGFQNPNWSDPMMGGQAISRACEGSYGATFLTFAPAVCSVVYGLIRS